MKKFCITGEGTDDGQSNWKQQAEQIQSQLKVMEQSRESEPLQENESPWAIDRARIQLPQPKVDEHLTEGHVWYPGPQRTSWLHQSTGPPREPPAVAKTGHLLNTAIEQQAD